MIGEIHLRITSIFIPLASILTIYWKGNFDSKPKNIQNLGKIVYLTTSFTISLRKDKVKVSHAKISHIFSQNKNASVQPQNYPIYMFFFCK